MIVMPNGLSRKRAETLTEDDIAWLAMGEDVCRKLGLTIACMRCLNSGLKTGAVIRGANNADDPVLTVTCDCRHMTYRQRVDGRA
jgi:hypothetical protein